MSVLRDTQGKRVSLNVVTQLSILHLTWREGGAVGQGSHRLGLGKLSTPQVLVDNGDRCSERYTSRGHCVVSFSLVE